MNSLAEAVDYQINNDSRLDKTLVINRGTESNVIKENTSTELNFNVMPGRPVEEKLYVKEYHIGKNWIEVEFDREYFSSMVNSPDHLIFLSALVHMQKMLYVYMCNYLELEYDPFQDEVIKVWPTDLNITMPKLITSHNGLIHRMDISRIRLLKEGIYHVTADTNVNNIITINGAAMIYLL